MVSLRRHKPISLALALSFVLFSILACGQSSNANPSPTEAAIPFEGRLLLLQERSSPGFQVLELLPGAEAPRVLWSDLPGSFTDSSDNSYTINPVVSPDGTLVVLPGSLSLVNLLTGDLTEVPLPDALWEAMRSNKTQRDFQPAFSPDNRHLAFSIRGTEQRDYPQSGLYLLDIASGSVTTLLEAPCAMYQGMVCGTVSRPVWLDETTLVIHHFVGEMPATVTYPDMPELRPNHTTILDVDGSILQEFDHFMGVQVRGQTAILYTEDEVFWQGVEDLKQGLLSGTPLEADEWIEFSPDGQFVYYRDQGRLVELGSGASTTLTAFSSGVDHFIWFQDGNYIAVWQEVTDEISILSLEDGSIILLTDLDEVSQKGWWALAWLP